MTALTRRRFLRDLATGLMVAAAPVVAIEPERRWWAVPRNAPVPDKTDLWTVVGDPSEIGSSADGVTWPVTHTSVGDDIQAALSAWPDDRVANVERSWVDTQASMLGLERMPGESTHSLRVRMRDLLRPPPTRVYDGGKLTVRLNGVELKTVGHAELQLGGSIGVPEPLPVIEPVKFEFAFDVDRGVETVSRTVDHERARREMDEVLERMKAQYAAWVERGWIAPQRG